MRSRATLPRIITLFLIAVFALSGASASLAQDGNKARKFTVQRLKPIGKTIGTVKAGPRAVAPNANGMVSVVVKITDESLASYTGGISGLAATSPAATGGELNIASTDSQKYLGYLDGQINAVEQAVKSTVKGARVTHRYNIVVGGIAMVLPANQLDAVAKLPGVEAVYVDELEKTNTDSTPAFIGATTAWEQLGGQESAGEGVVVGILDSGVWPEHPSFSDPDPAGKPYARPIVRAGIPCRFGSSITGDVPFTCNNKLIGGYRFMSAYDAFIGIGPGEFLSSRDDDGHGTHTATTSAGNGGVAASIFGVSRGTISGIAPRASVINYKVCGIDGCFGSDSAAAVQQAIRDGVRVINFSISGGANPYSDVVSLAFLDAFNAGIFVAASAGNSGPTADTTDHREPWVTTVAASTGSRAFKNTLTLFGSGGATLVLKGTSLTGALSTASPVVIPTSDTVCNGPFAPGSLTGKVVVCARGGPGRVQKGYNVKQGGAVGMILYNQAANVTDQQTDNHFLPATQIQYSEGQQVLAFLTANPGATATLSAGALDTQQGDVLASFSSRGGPGQSLGVSKPDITAPGVQILAGHTPLSAAISTGPQGELFQAIAGTSMSSPHIAGSAALVLALHPDWSPAEVRSALMTSARTAGVVKEDGVTPFTPFDAGSGRVDLSKAGNPGIVFNVDGWDLLNNPDTLWKTNYPSVYIPVFPGEITLQRTAKSVESVETDWRPRVVYPTGQPTDFSVNVPEYFSLPAGGSQTFDISIVGSAVPVGAVRFATIVLDGSRGLQAHMPVTIVRKQPAGLASSTTCSPATLAIGGTTNCAFKVTNTSLDEATVTAFDELPSQLALVPDSIGEYGFVADTNTVGLGDTLAGASPPDVAIASDPLGSPAGYLPLSGFGVAPIAGVGDETATNFNVPSFTFGGETYNRVGVVSNGYVVVGGAGGNADIQFINQNLPDPERPNNILAPFWTDLDPGSGGAMRISILGDGTNNWIVVDWENVREYSSASKTASFQIWIRVGTTEDITYTYGTVKGNGDGGFLTVGAENKFGNRGQNFYFDGVGALPTSTTELRVSTTPGVPGGSRTVTFKATGVSAGSWINCVKINSTSFSGTNTVCSNGTVTP